MPPAQVLDFEMDYIDRQTGTPSGYASLGVTGGEGKMNTAQTPPSPTSPSGARPWSTA